MQKIFEVLYNGKTSSFTLTKINRSKLYGSKKRIPVDAQGQECTRAALTHDGKYILPIGGTAMLYLDTQGDVAERNQLLGIDADGEVAENPLSDAAPEAIQLVTAAEILECAIIYAYALEPVFLCAELETSLFQGKIYRLPDCNGRQRFLIGNDAGCFLLIGERTGFEFIGLAEADFSPPYLNNEEMEEDDLDFHML